MTDSSSPSKSDELPDALPIGTRLGDFKITNTIGFGGFGMVYLAHEVLLDRTVAIKEYLPVAIAGRMGDQTVRVRSLDQLETYEAGLRSFVREAQLQARFSHPAMLEVYRVWEQNGTAYMAMRYYPGTSLRALRKAETTTQGLSETLIRNYLEPVCDAVRELHAQNVLHRDIAPDNILIMSNESPVLLDFGAARSVIAGSAQQLTTVLKPGYAPIEQYADDGTIAQGPWTDIYALGAVMYFLVMGTPPPQPVSRLMNDALKDFDAVAPARYSPEFVDAVRRALAVKPEHRFQSVEDLCAALGWNVAPRTFFKTNVSLPNVAQKSIAELEAALASARAATGSREATLANQITATTIPVARESSEPAKEVDPASRKAAPLVLAPAEQGAPETSPRAATAPVPRARKRAALWVVIPVLAAISYVVFRIANQDDAHVGGRAPERASKEIDTTPSVTPNPVVSPSAASSTVPIPAPASSSARDTTPVSAPVAPSAPQPAIALPPERAPITASPSPRIEKRERDKARTETIAAATPEQRTESSVRAKRVVDTPPAARTAAVETRVSASCEALYTKLSLGSIELTADERAKLATCK